MNVKQKLSVTALSITEILIGILLLINPVGLTTWIIIIAGVILTLTGIVKIISYFRLPAEEASLRKSLAFGILAVLAGLWCMLRSGWLIALFPLLTTLYGLIVLISGVTKVQWAADMIRLKKGAGAGWPFPPPLRSSVRSLFYGIPLPLPLRFGCLLASP